MINKITLNKVASYKNVATLETNKKVNLIYGLNGVGKSTLSNYLYDVEDGKYTDCSIEGLDDETELLVYNQKFIQDNFYEDKKLKGIFTLNKANSDAIKKINDAKIKKENFSKDKDSKNKELDKEEKALIKEKNSAKNKIWEIKTDYSGGDRVFEFCLEGLKHSKDVLFTYLLSLKKPEKELKKNINDLKKKIQSLSGEKAKKYPEIAKIEFNMQDIEMNEIFQKQIVGNDNSSISALIKELGNSDWVEEGKKYLLHEAHGTGICPFCQEDTITPKFIDELSRYFDESFLEDQNTIKSFYEQYSRAFDLLTTIDDYELNPIFESFKSDFEARYSELINILSDNKRKIENKIKTPSLPVTLQNSGSVLDNLNDVIEDINSAIKNHNSDVEDIETIRDKIKDSFWEIMRYDYDKTIENYELSKKHHKEKTDPIKSEIGELRQKIAEQDSIIVEQQKLTVNVDDAIEEINNGLIDIGITDFKIEKYSEQFYKIVREIKDGDDNSVDFWSLSEGEKTIISFFYFLKLCDGKTNPNTSDKKKIIVIDDPISSLSNVFVFNIGRLIKNEFFAKRKTRIDNDVNKISEWKYKYDQIFLLTHSLYFFYEITEINHEVREENQHLFRIIKNSKGSSIISMKYEEIQNDYQSYWSIIKDEACPSALIANCMRNIIEYFFNFVEKKDLNNFFNNNKNPALKNPKFQAFYRYINRESHSLGQNIFDFKEFNYSDFKEAFRNLFYETGYKEHYDKMIR